MRFIRFLQANIQGILRIVRLFGMILLAYLMQVAVMPYFSINSVIPNIMLATAAIIAVCYGKTRAYWAGAAFGILTETMCPTITRMNLLLYPIICTFSSAFFADKSEKRLEQERTMNRRGTNLHPFIRTPLCGLLNAAMYSTINTIYIYLGGTKLDAGHYARAIAFTFYTAVLTLIIMYPLRRILGFKTPKRTEKPIRGRYVSTV